jgi:hypothetical protein
MKTPALSLVRWPYDDSAWRVDIQATNGAFAGALEFDTDPEALADFGRRLSAFPVGPEDEVRFSLGSTEGNWAYFLSLRAFLCDRAGHAALEFAADNNDDARVHFVIPCEPAALRRLGQQLLLWLRHSDEPLHWLVAPT